MEKPYEAYTIPSLHLEMKKENPPTPKESDSSRKSSIQVFLVTCNFPAGV